MPASVPIQGSCTELTDHVTDAPPTDLDEEPELNTLLSEAEDALLAFWLISGGGGAEGVVGDHTGA